MENTLVKSRSLFNKVIYVLFIGLAIYQICGQKDYVEAAASLGIGLAFDPFDPKQTWNERPTWQKVWFIVHLAVVALLFGLGMGIGDK
ncbi:MAG: hypothetical protein PSV16_08610 [Flavobacterium sp.]|nr:hypothetical protein [Flavobacterium sp.]